MHVALFFWHISSDVLIALKKNLTGFYHKPGCTLILLKQIKHRFCETRRVFIVFFFLSKYSSI